ncbi:hypothetical protein COV18_01580 [Candidatus Woesearchaeota archaeon CG10_big_fil_rev_8_21_14_0_10_37_12]|nr:MAG: hypothetical protein COV18_01580 [Candidatus Woesearchaeota archaeon CG10_big_fil_rev_8_21_14_0_10_37_12]
MKKSALIATLLILLIILLISGILLAMNFAKPKPLPVVPHQQPTVQQPVVTNTQPVYQDIDETGDDSDESDDDDIPVDKEVLRRARVTQEEAKMIALSQVPGRVTDVEAERKRGKDAFVVEIRDGGDEIDVVIDIETGAVLGIERD